ncbi:hypothetical protein [Actinokineospora enzanensis]|uniref:hypothetical protein n=1 Tax=Actinokineospora enzanensis TaxID=155975 RepID=UPI00039E6265|nr:hypothetical protein [Actinokineospora enzanensis]
MDQQPRETTALRRALSRTLLVLGGTLASTAAAWAISTATAAADTANPADLSDDLRAVVGSVATLGQPAPAGDQQTVPVLDRVGVLVDHPVADRMTASLASTGNQAAQAVDKFGKDVAEQLSTPALAQTAQSAPTGLDLSGATMPGRLGQFVRDLGQIGTAGQHDTIPAAEARSGVEPLGAPAPEVVTTLTPAVPTAEEVTGKVGRFAVGRPARVDGDLAEQRGSPGTTREPVAPGLPTGPAPLAPLSTPAPATTGHSGGGTADFLGHSLVIAVPASAGSDQGRAQRTAPVLVLATTEPQPGVTPD